MDITFRKWETERREKVVKRFFRYSIEDLKRLIYLIEDLKRHINTDLMWNRNIQKQLFDRIDELTQIQERKTYTLWNKKCKEQVNKIRRIVNKRPKIGCSDDAWNDEFKDELHELTNIVDQKPNYRNENVLWYKLLKQQLWELKRQVNQRPISRFPPDIGNAAFKDEFHKPPNIVDQKPNQRFVDVLLNGEVKDELYEISKILKQKAKYREDEEPKNEKVENVAYQEPKQSNYGTVLNKEQLKDQKNLVNQRSDKCKILSKWTTFLVMILMMGSTVVYSQGTALDVKLIDTPVLLGGVANLECTTKFSEHPEFLHWTRIPSGETIAFRNRSSKQEKYRADYFFSASIIRYRLTINNITVSDLGSYKCYIEFRSNYTTLEFTEDEFLAVPRAMKVIKRISLKDKELTGKLLINNVYPQPRCEAFFEKKNVTNEVKVLTSNASKLFNTSIQVDMSTELCMGNIIVICSVGKYGHNVRHKEFVNNCSDKADTFQPTKILIVIASVVIVLVILVCCIRKRENC